MRILLLGGTGAMGMSLKDILAERGDEVYITSRSNHKDNGNVHYIKGDAHDDAFMAEILKDGYDTIVDFMIYGSSEFKVKAEQLLGATNQYIFTSSSRVYADSKTPITENSPRLLEVCKDEDYLKTDEYALAKAREENVLFGNDKKNWTIIRPYITYNVERLQLGGLEKDIWLRRALEGRSIPLSKDMAVCQTTMTYGGDVAAAIAALTGNKKAYGEVFNLTGLEYMTWSSVLNIYLDILKRTKNITPRVYISESSEEFYRKIGNRYQTMYDRLFNRVFDSSKLQVATGGDLTFCSIKEGLTRCVTEFLENPRWRENSPRFEAYLNRKFKEGIHTECFTDKKTKIKYFGWYYMPGLMNTLRKVKK